jgi:hypothetical protein
MEVRKGNGEERRARDMKKIIPSLNFNGHFPFVIIIIDNLSLLVG